MTPEGPAQGTGGRHALRVPTVASGPHTLQSSTPMSEEEVTLFRIYA